LASHYPKAPKHIIQEFAHIVSEENLFHNEKHSDNSKQTSLKEHFETTKISVIKQNEVDKALIKAFVCCNISFSIIENSFFTELLKTLCLEYKLPSHKKLSIEFLENKVTRINLKTQQIFETNNNLTLGKYKRIFFNIK
jgi:EAL domain-containing protein (putative c-di-GMP-specific phosphodiesterase class I)